MPVFLFAAAVFMFPGWGSTQTGSLIYSQLPDENECVLVCLDSLDVFTRPDSAALLFSRLAPGNEVSVSGVTADGWLGYDPGVAQAANIGSFRLRWIAGDEGFEIDGELGDVPLVWGPPAEITFAMIYEPLPLFSEPNNGSVIMDSLPGSSAASIVSRTENWYELDLNIGTIGQDITGWIESADVSVNGNLDSIPLIE